MSHGVLWGYSSLGGPPELGWGPSHQLAYTAHFVPTAMLQPAPSDIPAPESMHQELAQSEDYLQAKEDEIQKLRQDLDLKSNNIAELLGQ